MRHRGRTHLTSNYPLFEIFHRDISPNVPTQVNQDGVDAHERLTLGSEIVVVFNLGSRLRALQSQIIMQKSPGELLPVDVGVGYVVGVKIASCPAKFGAVGNGFQQFQLLIQTSYKNLDFFAQASRGGRLPMSAG